MEPLLEDRVPRIGDNVLNGVAFLYRSRTEAEAHAKIGGTCFIIGHQVHVDGKPVDAFVPYAVTNRHVVWNGGAPVIRINRRDGGKPDVIDLDCHDWTVHPGGDDVAIVCLIGRIDQAVHKLSFTETFRFITEEMAVENQLGVGDEVFMVGRFLNHQGRTDGKAAARFGSISMMPEPLRNPALDKDEMSYAVEMRSRTGFSGGVVVAYRTPATNLSDVRVQNFFGILGVNWGYILDEDGENTWLNGVVPAWKILETLQVPKFQDVQAKAADAWRHLNNPHPSDGVVPSMALPIALAVDETVAQVDVAEDESEGDRERFTALLSAAVKAPKPIG